MWKQRRNGGFRVQEIRTSILRRRFRGFLVGRLGLNGFWSWGFDEQAALAGSVVALGVNDGAGLGDETEPDTMPDGTKEAVHTFGWYKAKFVTDAKARGATAIICSPIPHKQRWETGRDFENLAAWDQQVAKNNGALYFDLTMVITDAYKIIGAETVATFFADKGTHTTDSGAQFNAAQVIAGLKSLPGNPLENYFSAKGRTIEAYKPARQIISTNPAKANP